MSIYYTVHPSQSKHTEAQTLCKMMLASYTDIKLNSYLLTKLRAMNKNILGMILVACLLSKSATAMVAVAHARPTVTDTRSTQEIYEYFRAHPGDPLPVEFAIARIRNLPDSPYYHPREGTDAWRAVYYLLPCRSENRKELAQLLVLSGSDLNKMLLETVNHTSYSPQYRPLIDILLDIGADVNTTNDSGETLLHLASSNSDSPTTVQTLLTHGAIPDTRDREGFTPLHRAITFSHLENARQLLEGGADVNLTDLKGYNTPLHLAVMNDGIKYISKKPLIMSILARTNVDILSRNKQGKTPLDIVRDSYYFVDPVQPVDFSSLLSTCAPQSTHYKAVKKFAKTVKKLEIANQARIDNSNKAKQSFFSRLFGTAPQPKSSGSNPASATNPAGEANPASSEQKPFFQSTEFKAIATLIIAGIIGKVVHSKLASLEHEKAQEAMKTIHTILETKPSLNESLKAFYTTLKQTANVSIQANELQRLFELSELKELSEKMQLIAHHQQKKLYKELNTAYQEHTAFFGVWQKICKVLSQSAPREKQPDAETSDALVSEVCTTVSTISEVIKTIIGKEK